MKKFVALMLSVMLLISCIASAEIATINVSATYMGQEIVNALINAGNDGDGCSVVSVIANAMGEVVSTMVQASEEAVTVVSGDQAITVTAEAVEQAIQMIANTVAAQSPAAAISQEDIETIMAVAMNEANRIAMIAMNLGIVTISESGDLTIYADNAALIAFVAEYLAELSADDSVFAAVASTGIWNALQYGDIAQIQAMIASTAAELASVSADEIGESIELYLTVSASTGSAQASFAYDNGYEAQTVQCSASDSSFNVAYESSNYYGDATTLTVEATPESVVCNYDDGENTFYYSFVNDGNIVAVKELIADRHTSRSFAEAFVAATNELSISVNETTSYSNNGVDLMLNVETLELTGSITSGEMTISVNGELQMFDNCIQYVITLTDGNETHSVSAGLNIAGAEHSAFVTVDDEYYMVTVDTQNMTAVVSANGVVLAECGLQMVDENTVCAYIAIEGMTYTVAVDMANYTATISVNGQELAECGLQMVDENTVCAYLTVEGTMTYAATVSAEETANGAAIAVSADVYTGEQAANVATANVEVAMSDEAFAHTTGYVMSAEEIASILMSVVESLAY